MKGDRLDLRYPSEKGRGDYTVPGSCTNCGWSGVLVLPQGREAPRGYRSARCKACGCKTVTATVKAAA